LFEIEQCNLIKFVQSRTGKAHIIKADQVSAETVAIGELQGRLRTVHFTAHIATRAVLTMTPSQIAKYDVLRGYQAMAASDR